MGMLVEWETVGEQVLERLVVLEWGKEVVGNE